VGGGGGGGGVDVNFAKISILKKKQNSSAVL